jgi:hypothetical protein
LGDENTLSLLQSGEPVAGDIWNTKKGYTRGLVGAPVKLQSEGVKRLVEDALWTQGVRGKLEGNKKRHEFQTDHGFRKTRCELSKVISLHIEILMNHSIGIRDSYMKPTEEDLLTDYLNAVDSLTINTEHILQKQVDRIKQETQNNEYIVTWKLQERDDQIQKLTSKNILNK